MTTIMRKEWLPTDMRKVLHVGPCNTPGGMAKVMEILSQNPPEGWQAEVLSSHSPKNFIQKLNAWLKARKWIKKNYKNYDVIHLHSAAGFSYRRKLNLARLSHKLGISVIFQIHSGQFDRFASNNKQIKSQLEPFTKVVLSDYWKETLEPIIGACHVLPNPVDEHIKFVPMESKKQKQMLLLGRKDPVKGHAFAMELARTMRDEGWNLVATGITHKEEGIDGLGWVSEQEKRKLLEESAVLLVPSAFEGQPMVILEGLAAGCRVVTSENVTGFEEIVLKLPMERKIWEKSLKNQSLKITNTDFPNNHSMAEVNHKLSSFYQSKDFIASKN